MTTTMTEPRPAAGTRRMPRTVRAAQAVLLVPMGLLQLVAVPAFSISLGLHSARDWAVASLGLLMALATTTAALRLGRPEPRYLRAALAVLAVQTLFSGIKLIAYHEHAAFVFFAMTVLVAGLLVSPASRRWFAVRT
jgi:hypothetical protein